MNARRTEITCTAMNILLRTKTLASKGEEGLANMKPPVAKRTAAAVLRPALRRPCLVDAPALTQVQGIHILPRGLVGLQAFAAKTGADSWKIQGTGAGGRSALAR